MLDSSIPAVEHLDTGFVVHLSCWLLPLSFSIKVLYTVVVPEFRWFDCVFHVAPYPSRLISVHFTGYF